MTQVATVNKIINDEFAEITVPRQSACGHNCADCAGCGMTGGYSVHAVAHNHIQAKPGDKVVVEGSTRKVLGVAVLVYVGPFICFFLGYALGHIFFSFGDGMSGLVGAICFLLGLIPAFVYNRYAKKTGALQYDIVRLF